MRRAGWVRLVVGGTWLVLMGWLIRFEAYPEWFTRVHAGYRSLMATGPVVEDRWMKVVFQDRHIGYTHTQIQTLEDRGDERYELLNETRLTLNVLGHPERVHVEARARLDHLYQLQSFWFEVSGLTYETRLAGRRVEGDQFEVEMGSGESIQRSTVDIPGNAMLYSPMLDMQISRLEPGQSKRFRLFEPVTLRVQDVLVEALREETIEVAGEGAVEALVTASSLQGITLTAWVDRRDGRTLRQETPLGWILEAAPPDVAMAYDRAGARSQDLVRTLAVPVIGRLVDPHGATRLRLRLEGASPEMPLLEGPRLRILERSDAGVEFELFHAEEVAGVEEPPLDPAARAAALAPSRLVQSDDPGIVAQARRITAEAETPRAVMEALYQWVYTRIEKTPAVSLPSAVDVLRERSGDCNEHTALYVALARAAGLPARMRVGIVYQDGMFYYHAWPAVHLEGRWHELDPTLGMPSVGPAHIPMLEGGLDQQAALLQVIGRIRVHVLDTPGASSAEEKGTVHAADD